MIAELIAGAYDVEGRPISEPSKKRHRYFKPTLPIARYLTQTLVVRCANLEDIRAFLATCSYTRDQEQFGREDYWQPPEVFETTRRGDCDCFALWTWRQLCDLSIPARFVVGFVGVRGGCHAWVTFQMNQRQYLLEPERAWLSASMPRLRTLAYRPGVSVSWDGRSPHYYEHEDFSGSFGLRKAMPFVPELVSYWVRNGPRLWVSRAGDLLGRLVRSRASRISPNRS
jgi:hypothetical protein